MTPIVRRFFPRMFRRAGIAAVALMLSAGLGTSGALAQANRGGIDEDTELDARMFGYEGKVAIGEKDSTTPLWFVYFFTVVVGCSALFKTAKRE
jgi:hypothetical protein